VPSEVIIPPLLEEIRWGNPRADITLLIATGCHRGTRQEELAGKFGEDVVARENIVVHDCDTSPTVDLGELPSGGRLRVPAQSLNRPSGSPKGESRIRSSRLSARALDTKRAGSLSASPPFLLCRMEDAH
jgi:hypothetical protein